MKKRIISFMLSVIMLFGCVSALPMSASAASYEDQLRAKGFTDSYITKLSALHKQYPNWNFEAFKTGLNWSDAVAGERKTHKQQNIEIQTSLPNSFYCDCPNCYKNGKYVITEGSNWVAASEAAVSYYLDPRNWLNEQYIFQFESTDYNSSHTKSGVESILSGTWMYNSLIDYVDTEGRNRRFDTYTKYSDAIMSAAQRSGMSAYYLASKIRQENGGSSPTAYAVRGTISPFQGIYNYYNIGANAGARDGLAWAAGYMKLLNNSTMYSSFDGSTVGGTKTNLYSGQYMTWIDLVTDKYDDDYYKVRLYTENGPNSYTEGKIGYVPRKDVRTTYLGGTDAPGYGRPWRTPYVSIICGAKWIYNNFKYQNTGYLQKFNVNKASGSLYGHEYMANVQGAASEATSAYNAYKKAGILSSSMTFYIPVFNNMPSSPCPRPGSKPVVPTPQVTGLELEGRSSYVLYFKWNAVRDATSYYIDVVNNTTGYHFHMTSPTNSVGVTGLNPEHMYTVKVQAYANGMWGDYSTSLSYRTRPLVVTGARIKDYDSNSITLTWDENHAVHGYKIYRYYSDGTATLYKTINDSSITSCKITGLGSGYAQYFKIASYYDGVNSGMTDAIKGQTAPAKVTGVSLTTNSNHDIGVKWDFASGSASGYQIQFSRSYNFSTSIAIVSRGYQSTTSYTGKNFTKGVWYYVRVRTYKYIGNNTYYGPWSEKAYINCK